MSSDQLMKDNTTPMSWAAVTSIVSNPEQLYLLGRSPTDLKDYVDRMEVIKETYNSVSDYIRITKFGYLPVKVDDGDKIKAVVDNGMEEVVIKLEQNDYPYNFDDGIVHYILWKCITTTPTTTTCTTTSTTTTNAAAATTNNDNDITTGEIKSSINKLLEGGAIECCHWINPIELKSIKDFHHAHILARYDV